MTILSPKDDTVVPGNVTVRGRASVPTGHELWLLMQAQHGDPRYKATTPKPIAVDASGAWSARITIGRDQRDAGRRARLVAVISPLDGGIQRHVKLLPKGQRYPWLDDIPDDCDAAAEIEVTRAG